MQRFYWPFSSLDEASSLTITEKEHAELFHQLTNVLRLKLEDEVCFFNNGSDHDARFSLEKIEKRSLTFNFKGVKDVAKELRFQLSLAQAIPQKSEKWEWILQKGTELGVQQFIPLITERTQRQQLPKPERMQRILIEAAEQSGRTTIPIISTPTMLSTWVPPVTSFVASLQASQKLLSQIHSISELHAITLIIGPEGGLTIAEEQKLNQHQVIPYSLGSTVLRLETAAIVSLGIVNQI